MEPMFPLSSSSGISNWNVFLATFLYLIFSNVTTHLHVHVWSSDANVADPLEDIHFINPEDGSFNNCLYVKLFLAQNSFKSLKKVG